MKSVLSIQDLSCVGRCSLTVALPVLSAMGCRCSVLPTAVLSTHTGFPNPKIVPLTEHISGIGDHIAQIGASFDAVTVGYLAGPDQAAAILPLLRYYRSQGSLIIVDPAMGDHGRLYSGLNGEHVQAMTALCREADILLPNVTEAALLTGNDYQEAPEEDFLSALTEAALQLPGSAVVITGVSGKDGTIGFCGAEKHTGPFSYRTEVVPKQFHGTGDLFAAVFTGAVLAGRSVCQAATAAADFVRTCVAGTPNVTPYGVEFERQLPQLISFFQD